MSGRDGGWLLPADIDPERICVTLNIPNDQTHLAAFWGALWELTYWFNWQRDPTHKGKQVADVWKQVWYEANDAYNAQTGCSAGDEMRLRQKPENEAILQQEQTAGQWTDVFDYSFLTASTPTIPVIDVDVEFQQHNYYDTIDNGSATGGVNANAPTTVFNGDLSQFREDALCMALTAWCNRVWAVNVQRYNTLVQAGVFGSGANTLNILLLLGSAVFNLASGIILVDAAGMVAQTEGHPDIYGDAPAMYELVQAIYSALRGQTISAANFLSRINTVSVTGSSHKDFLLRAIKDAASNRENYLVFVDYLGKAYTMRQSGVNEGACSTVVDWKAQINNNNYGGIWEFITGDVLRIINSADAGVKIGSSWDGWYCGGIQVPNGVKLRAKVLNANWIDSAPSDPTPAMGAKARIRLFTFNLDVNTAAGIGTQSGTTTGQAFIYVLSYGQPQYTYFEVVQIP